MDLLKLLNKMMRPSFNVIIRNRWGFTKEEFAKARELGLFDVLGLEAMQYWLVADPVCSNHCSSCHNEGRPLYFDPMGALIRHKCPPGICIHGLSQISPLIYDYYDHLLQGKDPGEMIFNHVTCTDAGVELGGLGDNLFRVTRERMPLVEQLRFILTLMPYLFIKNKRARGECRAVVEAPTSGGPEPDEFMKGLPLQPGELEAFLASPQRVRRLSAAERFQEHHIVIEVVSSRACPAGHKESDEFHIDSMGVVLPPEDGSGICIMALTKIWWRVLLMLERMAAAGDSEGDFEGKLFDLPMNCYGAGLPLGACGEIMMTVKVRGV
jgi:uncharacterized repeat protein (TIGR04076 family)